MNSQLVGNVVTATFEGADLFVTKSKVAPTQLVSGFPATYTLTVQNTGPLTATNVVITDTLPSELTYASSSSAANLTFSQSGSNLVWQAGDDLGPSQSLGVTLVTTVASGLADGTPVTNTLTATTAAVELNTTNNTAIAAAPARPPRPQLTLSPGSPALALKPGQTQSLTMTVGNSGDLLMTNIVMTGPTVMPWLDIAPTSLTDLAPGQQTVITLTASPGSSAPVGTYRDFIMAGEGSGSQQRAILRVDLLPTTRTLQLTFNNDQGQPVSGAAINLLLADALVDVTPAFTNTLDVSTGGTTGPDGLLTLTDLPLGTYDYAEITAPNHDSLAAGTLTVSAGGSTQNESFTLTARPALQVTPLSPVLAVAPDETGSQEFTITNQGAAPLTGLSIVTGTLPTWVYLGAPSLVTTTLQPNESYTFILYASPTITDEGVTYQQPITVSVAGGLQQVIAPTIKVTADNTRNLALTVTGSNNQALTGATVTLVRQAPSFQVTQGVTRTYHERFTAQANSSGQASFTALPVGGYDYVVQKQGYKTSEGSLQVELPGSGGSSSQQLAFELAASPFDYIWSVTPLQVGYEISLTMTHAVDNQEIQLLAPTRSWDFCQADPTLQDAIPIYNVSNASANFGAVQIDVPGVNVTVNSFPTVLAPGESGVINVSATRVSEAIGQGTILIQGSYQAADNDRVSYTFNPSSVTSPYFAEGATHQQNYLLEPGVFNPAALYTLVISQPALLDWISLTPSVTGTFALTQETDITVTLTATAPTWLTQGETYSDTAVLTLVGSDGDTRQNYLDLEAEKTAQGLKLHTTFRLGQIAVVQNPLESTGLIYPKLINCDGGGGGGGPTNSNGNSGGWTWTPLPGSGAVRGTLQSSNGSSSLTPPFAEVLNTAEAWVIGEADQQVRLKLDQRLLLEGEGFQADLTLANQLTSQNVDNIRVSLRISDTSNVPVNASFIITPVVPTLLAESLPTGQQILGSWLIVPTENITATTGKTYYAAAEISYEIGGTSYTFATLPEQFTVLPAPELAVDYVLPNPNLVCSIFDLEATVSNTGVGAARGVNLTSGQPKVVESTSANPQGFRIVDVLVEDQPLSKPELAVTLGDIPAGQSRRVLWRMQTTQPGRFVEFTSGYHRLQDYAGLPLVAPRLTITTTLSNQGCLAQNIASIKILQPLNNTVITTPTVPLQVEVTDNQTTQVVTYPVRVTLAYQEMVSGTSPVTQTLDLAYESSDQLQNKDYYTGIWTPTHTGDVLMTAEINDATVVDTNGMKPSDTIFVTVECPYPIPLSRIGQIISDTVRPPATGNCGSTFEKLITTPSDSNGDSAQVFNEFAILARNAKYEIAFTSMDWGHGFKSDSENNPQKNYPGDILLDAIKFKYDNVISNTTAYSQGMTVRILVGISPILDSTQVDTILKELAKRGIPSTAASGKWRIEVAYYRAIPDNKWSHVKVMIVDGETVIATGYNMTNVYFLGPDEKSWIDMGVKLSGAVAQEALEMFDDNLWNGSLVCTDYILEEGTLQGWCTGFDIGGEMEHVPEVLAPKSGSGQNAFSLFRSSQNPTANDAIMAAMSSSNQSLKLMQAFIAWYNFWDSEPPRFINGMLQAMENGSTVRYIYDGKVDATGPVELFNANGGLINSITYWRIQKLAKNRGLDLTKLEARATRDRMHSKALSIDGQIFIDGSLNFDATSWSGGIMDLAEYDIAIDDANAVSEYDQYFETMWNDSSKTAPILSYDATYPNQTIQNLVNQAQPYSIIILPPGIYQESVLIDKPLLIVGVSGTDTIIEPPNGQSAFEATSSDVFISHLTIRGSTGYGIKLIDVSSNSLKDIFIRKVTFDNNALGGILVEGLIPGSPINYTLENNTFIGGQSGVRLNLLEQQAITSTIRNNIFFGQSATPIKIDGTTDGKVEYGYNLFNNCARSSGGVCPEDWYTGNLSSASNIHDNLLNLDPSFSDSAAGNYTLQPNSPIIDAGDPTIVNETGWDGLTAKRADIGAFEAESALDIPSTHFQEVNGQVVMEAEHFTGSLWRGSHSWLTQTSLIGSTGSGYLSALPDADLRFETPYTTTNPELQYTINFSTTGIYTIWLRGYAPNAAGDSFYLTLDNQPSMTLTGFAPGMWAWANKRVNDSVSGASTGATLEITEPGLHTLRLWQREDGLRLDRIVLTFDSSYNPTGNGPMESDRASNY